MLAYVSLVCQQYILLYAPNFHQIMLFNKTTHCLRHAANKIITPKTVYIFRSKTIHKHMVISMK